MRRPSRRCSPKGGVEVREWLDEDGLPHRIGGPAVEFHDGFKEWHTSQTLRAWQPGMSSSNILSKTADDISRCPGYEPWIGGNGT